MFEKLAKIEDTFLGYEDHGILTTYLYVNYGDATHQGVGGYALDEYNAHPDIARREGTAFGLEFISRTLKVCGVDSWEKIKGRTIFVISDSDKWNSQIIGIKSLPTEGKEIFIFKDLVDKYVNI